MQLLPCSRDELTMNLVQTNNCSYRYLHYWAAKVARLRLPPGAVRAVDGTGHSSGDEV
jgi:hypothetical protein